MSAHIFIAEMFHTAQLMPTVIFINTITFSSNTFSTVINELVVNISDYFKAYLEFSDHCQHMKREFM